MVKNNQNSNLIPFNAAKNEEHNTPFKVTEVQQTGASSLIVSEIEIS